MATPPTIYLSGLRCDANVRKTSDWNLLSGTAELLYLLSKPPSVHTPVRAKSLRYGERFSRSRLGDRAQIP
jgi:hypothetical protein